MAQDYYDEHGEEYELVAGYLSPVNDCYQKQGLAAAHHRVTMCQLATETTSTWIMVDPWESIQPAYQRTAPVLDHFNEQLNGLIGGMPLSTGERKPFKIMLLAGGDLIQSFGEPNVWASKDLHRILGGYGCTIIERTGTDVYDFLLSHDILFEHRRNVHVVKQLIYNDISSTKVRLFIRRKMSIKYLLPDP
ncbi:Nicotinamide/nicotinic acid mononucleotide adenylyltransferase 1, partial [Dimargaris cristalligena]